jgi:nicotinamide mononucleotide adenylyltransferase
MAQANKIPLVLVACGSFSPLTVLHMQMLEMTERYVTKSTNLEVVGSYLSFLNLFLYQIAVLFLFL